MYSILWQFPFKNLILWLLFHIYANIYEDIENRIQDVSISDIVDDLMQWKWK
jgi:Na+/melibiose symporter-like transporter